MADDRELARGILAETRKARRRFEARFGDAVERAFEHCRTARNLGLVLPDYSHGVAAAAARALLGSLPPHSNDIRLGPFVSRALGHRDLALVILLRREEPSAWSAFRDQYRGPVGQIFLRCGHGGEEAGDLFDELVAELRSPRPDGSLALDDYLGRVDLQVWLFVYVWNRFRGGFRPATAVRRETTTRPFMAPDPEMWEGVLEAARAELGAFSAPDRRAIIEAARGGLTLDDIAAGGPSLDRLSLIGGQLLRRIADRMRLSGARETDTSRIVDTALADLAAELAPVCGQDWAEGSA